MTLSSKRPNKIYAILFYQRKGRNLQTIIKLNQTDKKGVILKSVQSIDVDMTRKQVVLILNSEKRGKQTVRLIPDRIILKDMKFKSEPKMHTYLGDGLNFFWTQNFSNCDFTFIEPMLIPKYPNGTYTLPQYSLDRMKQIASMNIDDIQKEAVEKVIKKRKSRKKS